MKLETHFNGQLIRRLSLLFVILGLVPVVLITIVPALYVVQNNISVVAETLTLIWLAQGVAFVAVVLLGGSVTLNRLAMPIQHLVRGARAIAEGDLSYRVPLNHGDNELIALTETFNAMAEAVEIMRDGIEEQRAALQTALDEREREFDAIVEIASLANTQADLSSTMARALSIARPMLGTDMIALAVLDEAQNLSLFSAACHDCPCSHPCRGEQCPRQLLLYAALRQMEPTLIQTAIASSDKVRVDDVQAEGAWLGPELLGLLAQLDVGRMAIQPLITKGRVLGILFLMRHGVHKIPQRAITLLDTLAENIAVLIENWHLQNEVRKLTIMDERRRLASELHDSVTQSLFTLSLTARGLKSSLGHAPGANQQALDLLIDQTRVIQGEMRTLINELRPIDLEADDLDQALRQHVQSIRRATSIDVKLSVQGSVRRIPKPVQQNLNRIAQEALSNVARHASASVASLCLEVTDQVAILTISDNGIGFDPRVASLRQAGSLGLISMRERAEMLGGALLVRSHPGEDTVITAQIPLQIRRESLDAG